MKPSLVILAPKDDQTKQADRAALVKFFQECAQKAAAGEILGLLALVQTKTNYEHTRIGFSYEAALGMIHRQAHLLLRDWDRK